MVRLVWLVVSTVPCLGMAVFAITLVERWGVTGWPRGDDWTFELARDPFGAAGAALLVACGFAFDRVWPDPAEADSLDRDAAFDRWREKNSIDVRNADTRILLEYERAFERENPERTLPKEQGRIDRRGHPSRLEKYPRLFPMPLDAAHESVPAPAVDSRFGFAHQHRPQHPPVQTVIMLPHGRKVADVILPLSPEELLVRSRDRD